MLLPVSEGFGNGGVLTEPAAELTLTAALGVVAGDVVAFVGGGGKTRLAANEVCLAPAHVRTVAALPAALATSPHVLLTGDVDVASGKALGVSPDVLCTLQLPLTVLLVEADGARRLSFKAPAEHEPLIPACSTLVVPVVGMDAVGKPLSSQHVHRPELVSRIHAGDTVTPEMIAAVIAHPHGGRKNVPAGARVVLLLNKIESDDRQRLAREIAARVLNTGQIAAVVLAVLRETGRPVLEVLHR
jgi:molybdenum cofactor cytidylyltransferase